MKKLFSMINDRVKKALISIIIDAFGIGICVSMAIFTPILVDLLKGTELILGVMAGIWLYVPIRNFIKNALKKRS